MKRVWEVSPTDERIIEDIMAWHRVIKKIIEYKGIVVPDEALRHGRRYEKLDGGGYLQHKPIKRQRKDTLAGMAPPIHPDAQEGWDSFDSHG